MEAEIIRIAIFASGNGSNAENIIRFCIEHKNHLKVSSLVCDKKDALVIERAKKLGVPVHLIPFERGENSCGVAREKHEKQILNKISGQQIKWICLAGYMRILSQGFLDNFYDTELGCSRVINIHPSKLPEFPGTDSYKRAFDANVKKSGVTIHFVDSGVDTGEIILQEEFPRFDHDTLETFSQRGLELEYKLYRKVLSLLMEGKCKP